MKFIKYLFILSILFLFSCDGSDSEYGSDDLCYLAAGLTALELEDEEHCTFNVHVEDDLGNTYDVQNTTPQTIFLQLPKNRCYTLWVINEPGDPGVCHITYGIADCYTFETTVHGRPEGADPATWDLKFCLDDECNCPEVEENT